MKGIQYIIDGKGSKTGVLIDLKKHGDLWEDFYDSALARERTSEPRMSFDDVKKQLHRSRPRKNGR